jgi:transcriptional regulator with XRE-family HTH domain
MEKIDQAIANVLRELREHKRLSQEQLSFDADLHRTYISQLERGLKSITVKSLFKITNALDIDIDIFLKKVIDELKKL